MTGPRFRGVVRREPPIELAGFDGRIDVVPGGWRYKILDLDRQPGHQLITSGVLGSQPDALDAAHHAIWVATSFAVVFDPPAGP